MPVQPTIYGILAEGPDVFAASLRLITNSFATGAPTSVGALVEPSVPGYQRITGNTLGTLFPGLQIVPGNLVRLVSRQLQFANLSQVSAVVTGLALVHEPSPGAPVLLSVTPARIVWAPGRIILGRLNLTAYIHDGGN